MGLHIIPWMIVVVRYAHFQPQLWFYFVYTQLLWALESGFDHNDRPSYWCNLWSGDKQFMPSSGKLSKSNCLLQILSDALALNSLLVPYSNIKQNRIKDSKLHS